MALLFRSVKQVWQFSEELSDPANVSFITSPIFLVSFLTTYVLLVTKLVPSFMEHRRPYNIRRIIIVYNIIQILVNVYLVIKSLIVYAHSPYLICVESTMEHLITSGRWEVFFLKAFDCVETVFFVLKKNYRQVSFLHVYHHSGMVLLTWISLKFNLGPLVLFVPALNCFVHAVMFTYYLLSSIDPEWKKRTDLKKRLTQLQLIQFFLFVCHALSTWYCLAARILLRSEP
ncbi:unnamed protein product [Diabrotica balteata]|uniref:Elongation of very long chain fatty acids protein n=1 Tax=Diabrotica balteata TaxID=107213 RepID=A0A9N9T317_DIABA|nr:unnamed protein product [Diabrotica balteata]